jgi:hypothetical protein
MVKLVLPLMAALAFLAAVLFPVSSYSQGPQAEGPGIVYDFGQVSSIPVELTHIFSFDEDIASVLSLCECLAVEVKATAPQEVQVRFTPSGTGRQSAEAIIEAETGAVLKLYIYAEVKTHGTDEEKDKSSASD